MNKKELNPPQPGEKKTRSFLLHKNKRKTTSLEGDIPVPRITDDNIEDHREQILKTARKFIFPLRHSRHKIVTTTIILLVLAFISFSTVVLLDLYRYQDTSTFAYQITKVVPLPIAQVGNNMVYYENYLFDLRHYIHYFQSQQQVDFNSAQGKAQLNNQKKQSLNSAVNYAYIKIIAKQKHITIASKDVDAQIQMLKDQSKLGNDNKTFENVLKQYWGWSVSDFRRSIEQELLTNKVVDALDTTAQQKANAALAAINGGQDFSAVAKQYSDDSLTKDSGGVLSISISKNDKTVPVQTIDTLFKLKPNQTSGIINLGYGLEIVKNLGEQNGKIKAAHVFINFQPIDKLLTPYRDKQPPITYIKV